MANATEESLQQIIALLGGTSKVNTTVPLSAGTSASTPGTVASAPVTGFLRYSELILVATFAGPTGGTLDVVVQTSPDGVTWYDYVHFKQAGALVASATYWYAPANNDAITPIAATTGTATTLAEDSCAGGHWLDQLRVLEVSGAGVSAGAAVSIAAIGLSG